MLDGTDNLDIIESEERTEASTEHDNNVTQGSRQLALCSGVKSTAVVKYECVEMPAMYQELKENTNLNDPPSNWLHSHTQWESYIRDIALRREHSFVSFKMMRNYPELMENIDVVSDSENIKKLLKMPYSKAAVSMMVHRVGNTLMLDDFDIHRHLLRQKENDWTWLRTFFNETVQHGDDPQARIILRKNKSVEEWLQNQMMLTKFLYYSMGKSLETEDVVGQLTQALDQLSSSPLAATATPKRTAKPLHSMKEPLTDHQRNVVWSFENLQMLIGTDLPIFGGGTRPCISLRLRDSLKPINVLTGIDYWLDNLMCNVPEVAMCYHHNGIVQNYELLKTEDIPNLEDSKFSPIVIKDIAQNILSFLKSNATKEGHTYWLFKGQNDDIVKLYDLTTLCSHLMNDKDSNPFTVPVGILLYRVAHSMWCSRDARKKSHVIRALLLSCLELLNSDKHSQFVTSAHYILSDLYIEDSLFESTELPEYNSDESDQTEEIVVGGEDDTDVDDDGGEQSGASSSVSVTVLSTQGAVKRPSCLQDVLRRYPPITTDVEERCIQALQHISEGLESLITSRTGAGGSPSKYIVEEQAQADPHTAIPLRYQPLHTDKTHTSSEWDIPCYDEEVQPPRFSDSSLAVTSHSTAEPDQYWLAASKVLLLRKSAIVYNRLAKLKLNRERIGAALKYNVQALYCFATCVGLDKTKTDDNLALLGSLMISAGDILSEISRNKVQLNEFRREYEMTSLPARDEAILSLTERVVDKFAWPWMTEFPRTSFDSLLSSVRCYRIAKSSLSNAGVQEDAMVSFILRFGTVLKELGVHYTEEATSLINDYAKHEVVTAPMFSRLTRMWDLSREYLSEGISILKSISDTVNSAFLHLCLAALMRLCAQSLPIIAPLRTDVSLHVRQREFTVDERNYFLNAATSYKMALQLLGRRESQPTVWDSIMWDLSTVYFNLASLMQDHPPSNMAQQTIEADVREWMKESIQYCDCETVSSRQVAAQYRVANIRHRLASMHHNALRNESNDKKRKECRELAERDYSEASRLFFVLESPMELLRVQLERVTLFEYLMTNQTSSTTRVKTLQLSLQCILECQTPLNWLIGQLNDEELNQDTAAEAIKLMTIVESRLQETLKLIFKHTSTPDKKRKVDTEAVERYKSMYKESISKNSLLQTSAGLSLVENCRRLTALLSNITTLYQQNSNASDG